MALPGGMRFAVRFEDVFPAGCVLVPGSIAQAEDYDDRTGKRSPAKDKVTQGRVWTCRVMDMDPELGSRSREVAVKILADVQPVPPTGEMFERIEFTDMTVTPYLNDKTKRLAYSLRATGMVKPNGFKTAPAPSSKDGA
ncbi:plasmid replication, integration and excision activator [Nonomuraea sp. NPDC049419]|uniref:plasmid replication, integration and excision activator n=1 Tax=Nonomuraea sp. NPDC049419 TaxID=3155772 RepID=UPI00342C69E6